jgi:hypothetical protein
MQLRALKTLGVWLQVELASAGRVALAWVLEVLLFAPALLK